MEAIAAEELQLTADTEPNWHMGDDTEKSNKETKPPSSATTNVGDTSTAEPNRIVQATTSDAPHFDATSTTAIKITIDEQRQHDSSTANNNKDNNESKNTSPGPAMQAEQAEQAELPTQVGTQASAPQPDTPITTLAILQSPPASSSSQISEIADPAGMFLMDCDVFSKLHNAIVQETSHVSSEFIDCVAKCIDYGCVAMTIQSREERKGKYRRRGGSQRQAFQEAIQEVEDSKAAVRAAEKQLQATVDAYAKAVDSGSRKLILSEKEKQLTALLMQQKLMQHRLRMLYVNHGKAIEGDARCKQELGRFAELQQFLSDPNESHFEKLSKSRDKFKETNKDDSQWPHLINGSLDGFSRAFDNYYSYLYTSVMKTMSGDKKMIAKEHEVPLRSDASDSHREEAKERLSNADVVPACFHPPIPVVKFVNKQLIAPIAPPKPVNMMAKFANAAASLSGTVASIVKPTPPPRVESKTLPAQAPPQTTQSAAQLPLQKTAIPDKPAIPEKPTRSDKPLFKPPIPLKKGQTHRKPSQKKKEAWAEKPQSISSNQRTALLEAFTTPSSNPAWTTSSSNRESNRENNPESNRENNPVLRSAREIQSLRDEQKATQQAIATVESEIVAEEEARLEAQNRIIDLRKSAVTKTEMTLKQKQERLQAMLLEERQATLDAQSEERLKDERPLSDLYHVQSQLGERAGKTFYLPGVNSVRAVCEDFGKKCDAAYAKFGHSYAYPYGLHLSGDDRTARFRSAILYSESYQQVFCIGVTEDYNGAYDYKTGERIGTVKTQYEEVERELKETKEVFKGRRERRVVVGFGEGLFGQGGKVIREAIGIKPNEYVWEPLWTYEECTPQQWAKIYREITYGMTAITNFQVSKQVQDKSLFAGDS